MPEGHTIHRRARDHTRWFAGHRVLASSPQGRFADEADLIDGQRFERAEAWGKHLFHHYEGGVVVHVHLGLIGRFRVSKAPMAPPRGAVRLRLEGPDRGVDLIGPMVCRLGERALRDEVVARLGQDPLRADGDPDVVWAAIAGRRKAIGVVLADQSLMAGVGNVYRSELLFRAGIHPSTPVAALERGTFDALWDDTKALLQLGVQLDRIVTVDVANATAGRKLRLGERTHVYKKRRCPSCGTDIRRFKVGGRWAYACEACQPPP